MKVIFLDVDGVLNNGLTEIYSKEGWLFIDDYLVERLKKIVVATNAEIVLSSTWRLNNGDFTEVEKCLARFGLKIYSSTPILDPIHKQDKREEEIIAWLQTYKDQHNRDLDGFLILDDNTNFKTDIIGHCVFTDFVDGLLEEDVSIAIDVWNGKLQDNSTYHRWTM